MVKITCTSCGQALEADESAVGASSACPSCGKIIQIKAPILRVAHTVAVNPAITSAAPKQAKPPKNYLVIAGLCLGLLVVGYFALNAISDAVMYKKYEFPDMSFRCDRNWIVYKQDAACILSSSNRDLPQSIYIMPYRWMLNAGQSLEDKINQYKSNVISEQQSQGRAVSKTDNVQGVAGGHAYNAEIVVFKPFQGNGECFIDVRFAWGEHLLMGTTQFDYNSLPETQEINARLEEGLKNNLLMRMRELCSSLQIAPQQ